MYPISFEWNGKTYNGELNIVEVNGIQCYRVSVGSKLYEFIWNGSIWSDSTYNYKKYLPKDFARVLTAAIDKALLEGGYYTNKP